MPSKKSIPLRLKEHVVDAGEPIDRMVEVALTRPVDLSAYRRWRQGSRAYARANHASHRVAQAMPRATDPGYVGELVAELQSYVQDLPYDGAA